MTRWGLLVAVAALGCGKATSGTTSAPEVTEPLVVRDAQAIGAAAAIPGKRPACPAADKVVLVEPLYDAADETAPPVGWNLPLTARPAPDGGVTGPLTPDDAKAFGVTAVPKTVWIYRAGQPPCRGHVTDLTRNFDDAPGSMSVDARIEGCAPAGHDERGPWLGLAIDNDPRGCELATATAVAERLGEADGETWVRPTKDTPIPPALTALLPKPKAACTAPECESLWQVRAVQVATKAIAYDATLTWVRPGADSALCALAHDDDHALYTVGKAGAKRLDDGGTWQRLVGAFYDATGARALVLMGRGTYTVRPIAADGGAGPAITRVWYVPSADEPGTWSLAQYCGD